jgi:subtilisin family serine protease
MGNATNSRAQHASQGAAWAASAASSASPMSAAAAGNSGSRYPGSLLVAAVKKTIPNTTHASR